MAYNKKNGTEEDLIRIKNNVSDFRAYFKENYDSFHKFKDFVFNTTISKDERSLADSLLRPCLEFNMCESYLSRLRGEFAANEPSVSVTQFSDEHVDSKIEELCEGHLRHIMDESNNDNLQYDVFTDTTSGGFSAFKVITEYENDTSFTQRIRLKKIVDPTMCGWDKMAIDSHKGDGNYCFELFPMSQEDMKQEYGEDAIQGISYNGSFDDFSWSYTTQYNKKIAIVCHYYEKKKARKDIVKVFFPSEQGQQNGPLGKTRVLPESEYKKILKDWDLNYPMLQAPKVLGKRTTTITTICRYCICENKILDYVETDYAFLPLIFVDGNSQMIRMGEGGAIKQKTRPYIYNVYGMQKLINFSGSSLANELQNTPQSKMIVSLPSIPKQPGYQEVYTNPQVASIYVYEEFGPDGITRLTPPQVIGRPPIPQEISSTFFNGSSIVQTLLGSYDAALGIQKQNLSGVAIENGAMNSNSASMPYNVSWIKALNRALEICVDLMSKYMTDPMMLPIKEISGSTQNVAINVPGQPAMDFKSSLMKVHVEAGVNFELQRQKAFGMLTTLMKTSPVLQEMISMTEQGLEMICDNVDIRGIDSLKQQIPEFLQQKQGQMQQQQQMAMQSSPAALRQMELQQKAQSDQVDAQIKAATVSVQKQNSDTSRILALNEIKQSQDRMLLDSSKVQAQNARTAVELAVSHADTTHSHAMDMLHLHHEKEKSALDRMNDNNINKHEEIKNEP